MKNLLKENRGFVAFLMCFGFFRLAVADWNPIPSGSMRPTLLEGDVVLVDRLAYDVKLPLSDIALMEVGTPRRGDVVVFMSPNVVPENNYFFLGDNRDNSADSRYIGFVPRHLLVGRAHHILVSADIKGNWLPRLDRMGERIQ